MSAVAKKANVGRSTAAKKAPAKSAPRKPTNDTP